MSPRLTRADVAKRSIVVRKTIEFSLVCPRCGATTNIPFDFLVDLAMTDKTPPRLIGCYCLTCKERGYETQLVRADTPKVLS